LYVDVKKE